MRIVLDTNVLVSALISPGRLPDDAVPPLSDEWLAEIQRRSAEYDAGSVQPIPWEQVRADSLDLANYRGQRF